MSSSLVQSVMSMASSHSQHSHISTDTMSSMSGSYLAGVDSQPAGGDGGDVVGEEVLEEEGEEEGEEEEEDQQDDLMESRGPSQQDVVRSSERKLPLGFDTGTNSSCSFLWIFLLFCSRSFPRSLKTLTSPWRWRSRTRR